ncbi:ATP-binding protein [Streptomyces noursei]|uniref:ATP-binding protein n=1 Tax=Streptomyces noursei TaxID=1971 RepID=UPI00135209DB|nr:ATP-binding protein [Streptomyces noursei]
MSISPAPFVAAAREATDLVPVRISLAIIERFSEGLYSSPNKTFEELVSNSYDAGAEHVWVYMPSDLSAPHASILVIDDGESMDVQGLQDLWRIGKSRKREEGRQRKREPIGKFGIGKLATYVLAEELTYLVLKDGVYRAVTMDYQMVQGDMSEPHTLNLEVVELTQDEAKEALLSNLHDYGVRMKTVLEVLFPDDGAGPENWTAAVMTRLKKPAQGIQQGRLKWVLSSAIPLNPSFNLYYNGDSIEASKAQGEVIWRFTVGESEESLPPERRIGKAGSSKVDGGEVPAYTLPLAGKVWGQAQLFSDSLQKGNSEKLGRSHGFFVRVRNRLINLDDPTFNVGPELRHGTLTRFNMVINADDLDELVASPRESIRDSPEVRELKEYMLAVFNRARSMLSALDEKDRLPVLTQQGRISNPPPGLTQGPLRRMLRRAAQGDAAVRDSLGIKPDENALPGEVFDQDERHEVLEQILVEPSSEDGRLISYDPRRRAAVINQAHPFISNYIDNKGTQEALQLLGLTELLTQAYMLDESIDAVTVNRIMKRRDAFLRDLVSYHPRTAPVVAKNLREASNDEKLLEDAVADALSIMGYHVQRVGGGGTPDGIATVRLGRRNGGKSESYALTYDAKSSGSDARRMLDPDSKQPSGKTPRIQAGTARTSVLRVHRERAAGQFKLEIAPSYTLLVAPGFQGDGDEKALIGDICRNDGITPITVEDLARLVELFPLRRLSPLKLREMFYLHTPDAVRDFVNKIDEQEPPEAPPVTEVIDLLVQYSERRTPVTVDTIMTAVYERRGIDLDRDEVTAIVRGLAALAPVTMYFDGQLVALNATPQGLLGELTQTLGEYPHRMSDAYRSAVPVPRQRDGDEK